MWQQILFYLSLLLTIITYFLVSADNIAAETEQLKLCGEQSTSIQSLVFVSTLDGKISALDAANFGQKQWTLDFNDGPMLSSSIHRRELNNNGQWIRLIPSLNGGLYKFDGENLEVIPISTDHLLRSSYRYSDDLIFSGGKELHSYSVSASTGKILYECNVNGCKNNTDREGYLEQDVLIIQRLQQTVRAVEARTGIERWNFSVGQHDLVLSPSADCSNKATLNIEIKAIIPEGLIWAVNKNDPTIKLWQYKFDSPIVTIWREDASKTSINKGSLEQINLFDSSQWSWGSEYSTVNPSIYLGMHEKQLYVQENFSLQDSDLDLSSTNIQHTRYPWQPYPADETALISTSLNENNRNEILDEASEVQSTTALSVLYNSEYINGNGFYLYSKNQLTDSQQCNRSNINMLNNTEKPMLTFVTEEDEKSDQIIMLFWRRWKEMTIITLFTTILLNYLFSPHFIFRNSNISFNNVITIFKAENTVLSPSIVEGQIEKSDIINDDNENINNFKSRYLTDFEPVDCLGKGGYGVVFEAKNKIDDCNYAIKRIALPNSQDSRERVMREVKALAKLDHHNIVRYFNAWLECPPHGWQEEHDQQWIDQLKSSGFPSEVTQTPSEVTQTRLNGSVCIDVSHTDPSSVDNALDALEFNDKRCVDDSFIVFEKSIKQYDTDAVYINGCSTDNSNLVSSRNETEEELSDDHSDSIVFEATDNNVIPKKEKYKHQKLFSSDLNKKSKKQKSAKMFLYIQMQLCQRLSLREWLKQHTSARDPFQVLNIFQQIIDAVEYVHLQNLIHRDLKPSNIFFAYDNKIKIGDFGLVTAMTEGCDEICTSDPKNENVTFKDIHTACVGTHLYMSPEQMSGQIYNYKVDIYSLGIIFFELLIPFFTDMERIVALSNLKQFIFPKNFAENYTAEYNLLKMMLDKEPNKRPTTFGIKSKLPLQNYEIVNELNIEKDSKWHFELPQLTRHSSVTSSSTSNESFEHISM